jgi:antitoxin VapB
MAETGESLTKAVQTALREWLKRRHTMRRSRMKARLAHLAADAARLPVIDHSEPDEIVGYDDRGLPR